jgi:hypothetical protein
MYVSLMAALFLAAFTVAPVLSAPLGDVAARGPGPSRLHLNRLVGDQDHDIIAARNDEINWPGEGYVRVRKVSTQGEDVDEE